MLLGLQFLGLLSVKSFYISALSAVNGTDSEAFKTKNEKENTIIFYPLSIFFMQIPSFYNDRDVRHIYWA